MARVKRLCAPMSVPAGGCTVFQYTRALPRPVPTKFLSWFRVDGAAADRATTQPSAACSSSRVIDSRSRSRAGSTVAPGIHEWLWCVARTCDKIRPASRSFRILRGCARRLASAPVGARSTAGASRRLGVASTRSDGSTLAGPRVGKVDRWVCSIGRCA